MGEDIGRIRAFADIHTTDEVTDDIEYDDTTLHVPAGFFPNEEQDSEDKTYKFDRLFVDGDQEMVLVCLFTYFRCIVRL